MRYPGKTANAVADAPLWMRIFGSFLSAVVGWTALLIILIPLLWSQFAPFDLSFSAVFVIVAIPGIYVFGTWIIALLPLYLLLPLDSVLWRWPIFTIAGMVSGATIMFLFLRMGSPREDGMVSLVVVASITGGVTCLFASLTRFRFQCKQAPFEPNIE